MNYQRLFSCLALGVGIWASEAGFAGPVLGPFQTTNGLTVQVELQLATSSQAVAAEPIIRVTGLSPAQPIAGFVILPREDGSSQTVPSETVPHVPLKFVFDGQNWVGRIVSNEVAASLPAAADGKLYNGYGLLLTLNGRAIQFRDPSRRRMHPAVLGLNLGDAMLEKNGCAAPILSSSF